METAVLEAQASINRLGEFQHHRPHTPEISGSIGKSDYSVRRSEQEGLSYHTRARMV